MIISGVISETIGMLPAMKITDPYSPTARAKAIAKGTPQLLLQQGAGNLLVVGDGEVHVPNRRVGEHDVLAVAADGPTEMGAQDSGVLFAAGDGKIGLAHGKGYPRLSTR